jgi:hypothetical protein
LHIIKQKINRTIKNFLGGNNMKKKNKDNSGLALIMVIGVLACLATIGISFAFNMRLEYKAAGNSVAAVKAANAAQTGIDEAIAILQEKAKTYAYECTSGDEANYSSALAGGVDFCTAYTVEIIDCAQQIYVNDNNDDGHLTRLLRNLAEVKIDGVDATPNFTPAKADNIISYIASKDRPLSSKEEIMQATGIGPGTYDEIKKYITVYAYVDPYTSIYNNDSNSFVPQPRAPINVNTAGDEVLKSVLTGLSTDSDDTEKTIDHNNEVEGDDEAYTVAEALIAARPIKSWGEFDAVIDAINESIDAGGLTNIEKEIIKVNCNPNLRMKEAKADGGCSIDKRDLTTGTTEFCFNSGGYYDLTSTGTYYLIIPEGYIVDNKDIVTGLPEYWVPGESVSGYPHPNDSGYSEDPQKGSFWSVQKTPEPVTYPVKGVIPEKGWYELSAWWPEWLFASTATPIIITHGTDVDFISISTVNVNQEINYKQWNNLGLYYLNPDIVELDKEPDIQVKRPDFGPNCRDEDAPCSNDCPDHTANEGDCPEHGPCYNYRDDVALADAFKLKKAMTKARRQINCIVKIYDIIKETTQAHFQPDLSKSEGERAILTDVETYPLSIDSGEEASTYDGQVKIVTVDMSTNPAVFCLHFKKSSVPNVDDCLKDCKGGLTAGGTASSSGDLLNEEDKGDILTDGASLGGDTLYYPSSCINSAQGSMDMWVKPCYSTPGTYYFFDAVDAGGSQIKIYDDNGTIKLMVTDGTVTHGTDPALAYTYTAADWYGRWHYIGISWDEDDSGASIARLYVDDNFLESSKGVMDMGLSGNFNIGTDNGGGSPANSVFDEFRIISVVMTDGNFDTNFLKGRFKKAGTSREFTSQYLPEDKERVLGSVLGTISGGYIPSWLSDSDTSITFKVDYLKEESSFKSISENPTVTSESGIRYKAIFDTESGALTASPVLDEVIITYMSSPYVLYRRENSYN